MMEDDLSGLSAADLDILFETNPYSYDSTVSDPTAPPSQFVQVMREQEERFYAAFPDAKRDADYRKHRKQQILEYLAARRVAQSARSLSPSDAFIPEYQYQYPSPPHVYDDVPDLVVADPIVHSHHQRSPPDYGVESELQSHYVPSPPVSSVHRGSEQSSSSTTSTDNLDGYNCATAGAVSASRSRSNRKNSKGLPLSKKKRGTHAARKRQQGDRKPTLACLFCRGRKIACGAPLPGGDGKTCNQCQRRSLRCEFPAESRRGMRKKKGRSKDEGSDSGS